MGIILVTGSCGLIGSETVRFFCEKDFRVIGIDNDMRSYFFGEEGSTNWQRERLKADFNNYEHYDKDIRSKEDIVRIFKEYSSDIDLVIHTAAQPSHDWAAKEPYMDFSVNAYGTLVLLECTRKYAADAVFILTSTNKVYGDSPNFLPLIEEELRWEIPEDHRYRNGIDESMSIDQSKHSLFGASKVAADILTQEYGKYFGIKTGILRGGCLTGPNHSGAQLHGFLSYLMKCAITGDKYHVFGYKGKQVRDNIHSYDFVNAMYHFYMNPKISEVYNMGGSRQINCSMLEAIMLCEDIAGKKINRIYEEKNRIGDHIWWISDVSKFKKHYPNWKYKYGLKEILIEIFENGKERWTT